MKLFIVCGLFTLMLCGRVFCENDVEEVEEKDDTVPTNIDEVEPSSKTKRGILHPGYGLTYNVPLGTAAYPHYGFQKPWHHVTYTKSPAVFGPHFLAQPQPPVHHHSVHHHPIVHPIAHPVVHTAHPAPQFIVTPGGATVSSYNVNYPRYPYYARPHHHVDVPISVPRPPPTFFVQPKPIIPVAVPAFSNRIPVINRPAYHHVVQSLPAPAPIYPVAPAVHPNHFVPIPLPPQPTVASFPTTFSTIPTFTTASVGTNFVGAAAPQAPVDQWRPIFVGPQATAATPSTFATAHRPPITLLPPFGSAPAGSSAVSTNEQQQALFHHQQQLELQQQYENTDYAEQQQFQPQVNQLYTSPIGDDQTNQDFIQGNHLQQQIEQQQQQRAIIQEQQQIHAAGPFNGQGYEPPSNNGHYAGPSSYEVQLNSYTRAV